MKFRSSKILPLLVCMLTVSACSNQAVYTGESFSSDSPFKVRINSDVALVCESARRALLGQGYLIENASSEEVKARKALTRDDKPNTFIELNVACLPKSSGTTLFATGLLSTYSLKKSSSSASVGVSALGSISLPIGQSADSLVKVSEETIDDKGFYQRFFAAIGEIVDEMQADQLASEPEPDTTETAPTPMLDPESETTPEPNVPAIPALAEDADADATEPTPVASQDAPPITSDFDTTETEFAVAPTATPAEAAPTEKTPEVTLQSILNEEMTRPVNKTGPYPNRDTPPMTLESILSHDAPAVTPGTTSGASASPPTPASIPEQEAPVLSAEPALTPVLETEQPAKPPEQTPPVDDLEWQYD